MTKMSITELQKFLILCQLRTTTPKTVPRMAIPARPDAICPKSIRFHSDPLRGLAVAAEATAGVALARRRRAVEEIQVVMRRPTSGTGSGIAALPAVSPQEVRWRAFRITSSLGFL